MAYATLEDLIERAGEPEIRQVADRDRDGIADPAVIEAAIAGAGETIDAYLGTRFALPLNPVPPIVRKWAVSLARYQLHRDGAPDYVLRDQRDAMAELKDASAGRAALPGATGMEPTQSGADRAIAEASPPTFTDSALEGWR